MSTSNLKDTNRGLKDTIKDIVDPENWGHEDQDDTFPWKFMALTLLILTLLYFGGHFVFYIIS